jgi:hypothetical protein
MDRLANEVQAMKDRPRIGMKGMLTGTEVVGNYLHLWFASPDGDSSDSQIFKMRCSSEEQAKFIEGQHRKVWGL